MCCFNFQHVVLGQRDGRPVRGRKAWLECQSWKFTCVSKRNVVFLFVQISLTCFNCRRCRNNDSIYQAMDFDEIKNLTATLNPEVRLSSISPHFIEDSTDRQKITQVLFYRHCKQTRLSRDFFAFSTHQFWDYLHHTSLILKQHLLRRGYPLTTQTILSLWSRQKSKCTTGAKRCCMSTEI